MYTDHIREEISQGDIFYDVPIAYVGSTPEFNAIEARVEYVRAVMLTYNCDFDKPNTQYIIFAQIQPLSEIDSGSRGNIRQNRVRNTFYLPAIDGVIEESYVDFRRIDRVHKGNVLHLSSAGKRISSLNDDAVFALQYGIARFFGVVTDP